MVKARREFEAGDLNASRTIKEANEIARETPGYVLPLGLGLAALIAGDTKERTAALAAGEQTLAAGTVAHNVIFFHRFAIEACLAAKDWSGVEHHAAALERGMATEPIPMADFLVARARALAAAGRGRKDAGELGRLVEEASRVGWQAMVRSLETALLAS